MTDDNLTIDLTLLELRAVTGYAAACAREALEIFETQRPGDLRPRTAINTAQAFADGAKRIKALRDSAWDAQRAAAESRDAGAYAASEAARSALAAAGAAFLHPLAKATQVKHILGSAAHAARAFELSGLGPPGDPPDISVGRYTARNHFVSIHSHSSPRHGGSFDEPCDGVQSAWRIGKAPFKQEAPFGP